MAKLSPPELHIDRAKARAIALAIVDDLFVNGAGDQAERLVLTSDSTPRRYLGGWSRIGARDRIVAILERELVSR